jgi:small nuclear ribonucleoprotein (snRNP)-like protein
MEEQAALEQRIQALMDKPVRITMSDQRVVSGKLHCVDSALNIIIHDGEIRLPSHSAGSIASSSVL